jgi:hypothetical protein
MEAPKIMKKYCENCYSFIEGENFKAVDFCIYKGFPVNKDSSCFKWELNTLLKIKNSES